MLPFLILAAMCVVAAYGLQRRTMWAWYAGWVLLYLAAGVYGAFTLAALFSATTLLATLAALVYVSGGGLLWLLAAVWWCGRRGAFGRRKSVSVTPANPTSPNPGPLETK